MKRSPEFSTKPSENVNAEPKTQYEIETARAEPIRVPCESVVSLSLSANSCTATKVSAHIAGPYRSAWTLSTCELRVGSSASTSRTMTACGSTSKCGRIKSIRA
eukprot:Amastigsp_a678136_37.p3 type:complete len:104 gc:universal Amastigsp_a678136_37:465-776(+)